MKLSKATVFTNTLLILSSLLFMNCDILQLNSSDDSGSSSPWSHEEINTIEAILSDAGVTSPLSEEKDEESSYEAIEDNNKYIYEVHDVVDNITSITYLGLNDDVIWPGAVVKGENVHNFVYDPILLDRDSLTISSSLASSKVWEKVDSPSLSNMRQAITELISRANDEGSLAPANAEFNISQVYSESDLAINVGASLSYGGGDIKSSFDWTSNSKQTKILGSYKQIYYTIDVDTPQSPADFFSDANSISDMESALGAGTKPMYVSSVSYGFMAYICIETDFSYEEMKAALDASYDNGTLDVELDFGYTSREVMESSNLNIVVYGGSTTGLDNLSNGLEGFNQIISASKDFSAETPGLPLIYRFRHLADNTLAEVTLTSQYTIKRFLNKANQIVNISCSRFVVNSADDEGLSNDIELDRLYAWVSAWNSSAPGVTATQATAPDTEVYGYSHGGDGWVTGSGGVRTVNSSVNISFDVDNYDLSNAIITLKAWARDYDSTSANEEDTSTLSFTGTDMLGEHKVNLTSADFNIDCIFNITLVN